MTTLPAIPAGAATCAATALPGGDDAVRSLALDDQDRVHPPLLHPRSALLRQLARLLETALDAVADPDGLILDVGCGRCPYRAMTLGRFARYAGADLAWNPKADLVIDARGRIPMDDASASAALSTQVLHALPDPQAHLREIHRVLRPGGAAIVSANTFWPYVPEPIDLRRWTLEGLRHEVAAAGLTVAQEHSVFGLAASAVQLLQDALAAQLPRALGPALRACTQTTIRILEATRRERDRANTNGCINMVVARKEALA